MAHILLHIYDTDGELLTMDHYSPPPLNNAVHKKIKCRISIVQKIKKNISDWCQRKEANVENVIFGNTHLKV